MKKTILVVEDDARIAELIGKYLHAEQLQYGWAGNGNDAMAMFTEINPDLVVLDIMLPELDGTSVCEKIRAISDVPIIMLTALSNEQDLLKGFAKGADDYISKPFNPRELIARIRAILRRTETSQKSPYLAHGPIGLNLNERLALVNGEPIQLTRIEFKILSQLMMNPNNVVSRSALLDGSHDDFSEACPRSIDFHIKNLRRKINVTDDMHYIKTVYGMGYTLL